MAAPLRADGLRIAVDDAGAGFASMRHILKIRPEIIKLDRSLISGIHNDSGQRALAATMVEFAAQIGAAIIAEGIEHHAELDAVAGLGIAAAQGYALGPPTTDQDTWVSWHRQFPAVNGIRGPRVRPAGQPSSQGLAP
ncbi:EAL domain-containing protein [Arthrobacter sp. KNU-44]|uniref:EAL domain-containing protein n=1 Tax=Arthrobacter sp. KNU-44 TaxID=3450744 RepID=UPI003F43FC1C